MGETIVITFPSGAIGIVDAHPSKYSHRPKILDLIRGKKLYFVCLSHPHEDHGLDLVQVMEQHVDIESFWHTIFDIPAFAFGISQAVNFPSELREYASKINQNWGNFFLDLLGAVAKRDISVHELRSDLVPALIEEVEIYCLSPDEIMQNSFSKAYLAKLRDLSIQLPDTNLLSAVLALKFGESLVLLGADALQKNWENALQLYHKRKLPKAAILKVPHHGARNALDLSRNAKTYLDVCSQNPKAKSVIFAGDAKHPNDDVYEKIRSKTDPICLSNGRKPTGQNSNPLNLQLLGATCIYPAPVCNPKVSFELDMDGNVSLVVGNDCKTACLPSKTN